MNRKTFICVLKTTNSFQGLLKGTLRRVSRETRNDRPRLLYLVVKPFYWTRKLRGLFFLIHGCSLNKLRWLMFRCLDFIKHLFLAPQEIIVLAKYRVTNCWPSNLKTWSGCTRRNWAQVYQTVQSFTVVTFFRFEKLQTISPSNQTLIITSIINKHNWSKMLLECLLTNINNAFKNMLSM